MVPNRYSVVGACLYDEDEAKVVLEAKDTSRNRRKLGILAGRLNRRESERVALDRFMRLNTAVGL